MANPAFDAPATDASARSAALPATAASVGSAGGQRRSAGLRGRAWQRLPGTAAEARQLSPLLQVSQPLTGQEATAAAALRQQGPRIFHIATHGFFEADQQQGDPLLRSGLVFAGANQPDADPADDGYLTAAEATGMKLEGTELVTLSACETGLGDVRSGEGVYGLQRSLAVAGARSTLLSLWQVDDELTTLFMEQFYRRLMAGQSRADALRDTQRAFRSESLESLVSMGASGQDGGKQRGSLAVVAADKGSGPAVAKHNSVYVWGAFQLSGDWRPLPR
jgi:CHAT domain-containing protein